MRQDTGSMVFNRLANRAFWSKNVAEEKFVTGSRHADDTFIDLRILRELDIKYIPGVGKAGKVILEHCQTMLDEVIAGPEPSDEVAEAPPAP